MSRALPLLRQRSGVLGSAGCQPAPAGSLPAGWKDAFYRARNLISPIGWQPIGHGLAARAPQRERDPARWRKRLHIYEPLAGCGNCKGAPFSIYSELTAYEQPPDTPTTSRS